ncbi:MAG: murein DD-endopeptidase MepM/ murein hydrolase activator NlpD [Gammaproteobacteria bacterium]
MSNGALAQDLIVVDLPLPPKNTADHQVAATRVAPLRLTKALSSTPRTTQPLAAQISTKRVPTPQAEASATTTLTAFDVSMGKGDSLARVFRRHGLMQADLLYMTRSTKSLGRRLRRMRVGQQLRFEVLSDGRISRLILSIPGPTDVLIERQASDTFTMQTLADTAIVTATHDRPEKHTLVQKGEQNLPPSLPPLPAAPEKLLAEARLPTKAPMGLSAEQEQPARTARSRQITVETGDSLYAIFNREGISAGDLEALLRSNKSKAQLHRLRPGQTLKLDLSPDNTLLGITVALDETRTFAALRTEQNSFTSSVTTRALERRIATASAVIQDALFLAGQRAGLSDRLIMKMIEIFGWDVDFALDVRAGDHFTVIYEELYKDGVKVRDGNILASEFNNRGRSLRALRYAKNEHSAEYFSPKGFSMRKAFLRTPVTFSRISSRFTSGRMHPVLQRMRAHKGVDYAARRGTPVKAAGHGRVVSSGRKGGYGNTVVLQHGGKYTTLYAHLSRIHSRAKAGRRVKQGEIIGYVGMTGLATGPHLHYEFRVRGVHKDPLRVTLPKALPIDRRYEKDFLVKTRTLVKQLNILAKTSIASSN